MNHVNFEYNGRRYSAYGNGEDIIIKYGLITMPARPGLMQAAQQKLAIRQGDNVIDLDDIRARRQGGVHAKNN